MDKGGLIIVLHYHLPWVRHPEHGHSTEEAWLFEALSECYIPLLDMLDTLRSEDVPAPLTISISPPLLAMLQDPLLMERFEAYLKRHKDLCGAEVRRLSADMDLGPVARMYAARANDVLTSFQDRHGRDLARSFLRLARTGTIELITTSATHAYLPNLSPFRRAVEQQVHMGIKSFEKFAGHLPAGFWLPECGYHEGLDAVLHREKVSYFFVESHGLLHASPRPPHGVYRPVRTACGTAVFARDSDTVQKVWNSAQGYPGSPEYRDFHRDAGFELPLDHIGPYLHPEGQRGFTGLKYWRVTGQTGEKGPYRPAEARELARTHAVDFVLHLEALTRDMVSRHGFAPCITALFDAELFGHWWFEGIHWLEDMLRELARSQTVAAVKPLDYLNAAGRLQTVTPSPSSWGRGGYGKTWTTGENATWLERILRATARLETLEDTLHNVPGQRHEALMLAQAELLLAQASDWPFMIKNDTFAEYARARLEYHLTSAEAFMRMASNSEVDAAAIKAHRDRLPDFLISA